MRDGAHLLATKQDSLVLGNGFEKILRSECQIKIARGVLKIEEYGREEMWGK